MGVSKNNGTPKSSILIGFSTINHPFWGTPIFGNTHIYGYTYRLLLSLALVQGMMKPGINESPASTLLEIALPLDHEGVMHHKKWNTSKPEQKEVRSF